MIKIKIPNNSGFWSGRPKKIIGALIFYFAD
ncbi:hypothetical protein Alsa1_CDS0222 [Staphylococcus phage Alsa_1]|nr:hypothetical protein Alsa1_CDS0222 [Staphylococcus phage Alsa_1]